MRKIRCSFPILAWLAGATLIQAQVVVYNFGSAGSPTSTASVVAANLTASVFAGNLGSPTTGSGSPVFSAGSGGSFFSASSWTGAAPGSNYFEFTLTPSAGYALSLSSISLGYRATGTGPTAFAIRSSADAFGASLVGGSITNDSAWHSSGALSITLSSLTTATTIRVYGSGASSGSGTFRIDDVSLAGSLALVAVPEPSAYGGILGAIAFIGVMIYRGRRCRDIPAATQSTSRGLAESTD